MNANTIKITFINPLNSTVESRNYSRTEVEGNKNISIEENINRSLEAEFGEEILYGMNAVQEA
jgi:hypothetical protein